MKKFSEKAAVVLNREKLQVINSDVWYGIQDPKKLRCELYWLDEHDNQITVEVPLYALHQAYDKIGHGCVINLICPSGAFIPSAIDINKDGSITPELPYEPLILNNEFNPKAQYETNIIVTEQEIIEAECGIAITIQ